LPLEGTIGSELLALTGLTALTISNAFLKGTISTYLGALTQLTFLDLAFNSFTGTIPSELGLLTNLDFLDLAFNSLDGPVPSSFARLSKLTFLDVSRNMLSGEVPALSFVSQCVLAARRDTRFADDKNCFDNCDNVTLCCENSIWPCGDAIAADSDGNLALIVGVVLGVLLAVAMVVVVVVVVRKSHSGADKKPDDIEVRINNSGYAAASEMADNGLPPSQQLTPQVSTMYSNPLDSADSPYNVMPGGAASPPAEPYVPWGSLSPMARPMPSPPGAMNNARGVPFVDAAEEYRNVHNHQSTAGQQSIPMPGSSGGLAQPYIAHPFLDQQQMQYREDRFVSGAAQSPW
jgi:hypothetical protein